MGRIDALREHFWSLDRERQRVLSKMRSLSRDLGDIDRELETTLSAIRLEGAPEGFLGELTGRQMDGRAIDPRLP